MTSGGSDKKKASIDGDPPEYFSMIETPVISHEADAGDGEDSESAGVPSISHMEQGLSEENYAIKRKREFIKEVIIYSSAILGVMIVLALILVTINAVEISSTL